jgi:hypothetical protein
MVWVWLLPPIGIIPTTMSTRVRRRRRLPALRIEAHLVTREQHGSPERLMWEQLCSGGNVFNIGEPIAPHSWTP